MTLEEFNEQLDSVVDMVENLNGQTVPLKNIGHVPSSMGPNRQAQTDEKMSASEKLELAINDPLVDMYFQHLSYEINRALE